VEVTKWKTNENSNGMRMDKNTSELYGLHSTRKELNLEIRAKWQLTGKQSTNGIQGAAITAQFGFLAVSCSNCY
jgi:hypothetical protein